MTMLTVEDEFVQKIIDQIICRLENNGLIRVVREGNLLVATKDGEEKPWMLVDGNRAIIQSGQDSPSGDSLDFFRGKMNG